MKPSPKPQLEKRKDTIEYKEGDPYIIITMSKEADKHAQGKQERKKVYCGGDHCSGLWNLPCNAPEHPRVEPLQARKECEIRIMDGWCWTHSRYHCTQEPEPNSDLLPFKHGEENTHYACKEMIEKLGDKVVCCACNGHKCQEPEPKQGWSERLEGQRVCFYDDEDAENIWEFEINDLKAFISQELAQAREEGRREAVEEIKHLYYNCEDGNGFHADELDSVKIRYGTGKKYLRPADRKHCFKKPNC